MKCFACDREIKEPINCEPGTANAFAADTQDGQWVYIGRECWRQLKAFTKENGKGGWQPRKGGPKLWRVD